MRRYDAPLGNRGLHLYFDRGGRGLLSHVPQPLLFFGEDMEQHQGLTWSELQAQPFSTGDGKAFLGNLNGESLRCPFH